MTNKLDKEIAEALAFTLRLEITKRISPARRRANQICAETLAGHLVAQIERANFVVTRGEPLQAAKICLKSW